MNIKNKSTASAIALAFVAMFWGTSYAVVKDTLNDISPLTLMTLRFTLSTIILCSIFIKRIFKVKKKELYHGSIIGLFLFFSFLTLVIGVLYTTASKQSFLIASYVLMVPFLAWVISKIKPGLYSIFAAVLATIGIGLLTLNGSLYINKGDLISIICAFAFACHMISIEYFNKDSDPIILTIIQFAVTSLLFIIFTGIFESYSFVLTPRVIKSILYQAVVTTVIPFVVQNVAQRYISSTSTALILTLESAFGGIFAIMVLKETMTVQMAIGCIIIFIGIIIEVTKCRFLKVIFYKNQRSDEIVRDFNCEKEY